MADVQDMFRVLTWCTDVAPCDARLDRNSLVQRTMRSSGISRTDTMWS